MPPAFEDHSLHLFEPLEGFLHRALSSSQQPCVLTGCLYLAAHVQRDQVPCNLSAYQASLFEQTGHGIESLIHLQGRTDLLQSSNVQFNARPRSVQARMREEVERESAKDA